jgi:uncharacterized membrane-anchored protein
VRTFSAPKVPAVFLFFWVTKLLTTGIGEAAADWMTHDYSVVVAGVVGVVGFVATLWWQMRSDTYHPVRYWLAVLMVAVLGTGAADGPHQVLGTPYWFDSFGYLVALLAVFWIWQRREGTLSVHSIVTSRREVFYWLAVLLTFGLGTSLGDFAANTLNLGFGKSALVFGVLILIPLGAWRLGASSVACFWAAYSLTRPLGASIADWLGKPVAKAADQAGTGLGWGDGTVTAIGLAIFAILVAYAAYTHSDEDHAAEASKYTELAHADA